MLSIIIGNDTIKSGVSNKIYQYQEVSSPSIAISNSIKLFTLLILDYNAQNPPFLHLLVINIPGNITPLNGDILAKYVPLKPPMNDPFHNYIFYLYVQPNRIVVNDIIPSNGFNLQQFTRRYHLNLVDSITLRIVNNDQTFPESEEGVDKVTEKMGKQSWIKSNSSLTEQQKKYCRCVLQVAEKQPGSCNMEKAWFEQREGKECYNPYAICAKSVQTSYRGCGDEYDFNNLPTNLVTAYANLNNIKTTGFERDDIIASIYRWKKQERK